ncbi:uncharacterized protein LOC141628168 [Silene latifolia]|uniref:uncharacterized protein LOC141628168 n=1 Tax=Silene latifolia TaxID=37657 RepID=UPI003D784F4A
MKLDHFFLPFERERVLSIHLSPNKDDDSWYWGLEKDGVYSVKSTYAMFEGAREADGGASVWKRERWLWNMLWKIAVWPRVKLFFWKLCSEPLATTDNISSRVRGESSLCYFCSSCSESCPHLFRDCGVAKWVWEGLVLEGEAEELQCGVREWIEHRWREMDASDYGKFMVGCWAIWEHHNKVVFDGVVVDPTRVVRRTNDVLHEGGGGMVGRGGRKVARVREGGNDGWCLAPEGKVKINVDAGVKEGEEVGTGAVCRDSQGALLWGLSVAREVEWESVFAEAVAVLDRLQEAASRGVREVVVESDCLQVIDALKEKRTGRSLFA